MASSLVTNVVRGRQEPDRLLLLIHGKGADEHDLEPLIPYLDPEGRFLRANVSEHIQVKAAGGVRTLPALLDVIDAGVTRCGATATATILDDFKRLKEGSSLAAPNAESAAGTY